MPAGSPPRVRSRQVGAIGSAIHRGITSACAEQTSTRPAGTGPPKDHLRVCGADSRAVLSMLGTAGSPPRVRSRRCAGTGCRRGTRITSACAEQTSRDSMIVLSIGDHLRVCGADSDVACHMQAVLGSPPRVRSRRRCHPRSCGAVGITSACAEQTRSSARSSSNRWDHLRVCGADPDGSAHIELARWITSACAEQTPRACLSQVR